jgi:nucleoside-diphosphate-sugar epimerase
MDIVLVTGSAGLIGSEAVRFFAKKGLQVVGIDNDMRRVFFGDEASTSWNRARVQEEIPGYIHASEDIRDKEAMERLFSEYGNDIKLIIHTAAQPSHDWAARDPFTPRRRSFFSPLLTKYMAIPQIISRLLNLKRVGKLTSPTLITPTVSTSP